MERIKDYLCHDCKLLLKVHENRKIDCYSRGKNTHPRRDKCCKAILPVGTVQGTGQIK